MSVSVFLSPNYVYSGTASISLFVLLYKRICKKKNVLLINLFANFLRLLLRTISHAKTSSIKMRIVMMSGLFSGNRTNKMSDIYYTLINIFGYKQSFSSCTSILIYIIRKKHTKNSIL